MKDIIKLSIVIPAYNEEESILELYTLINESLKKKNLYMKLFFFMMVVMTQPGKR